MGVEVDVVAGRAANNREKNVQLYRLTLWLPTRDHSLGNQLLTLMGRWIRAPHFRRPLFGVFNAAWEAIGSGRTALPRDCLDELMHACSLLPLASSNLRARTTGIVSCSDASEDGAG
eukprot:5728771-Pyramimonas_sp.AAC.1